VTDLEIGNGVTSLPENMRRKKLATA
jgi:hypothetical protein